MKTNGVYTRMEGVMKKDEVLKILYALHAETERLYHENGKNDFDAGRLDGIGWAIEEIKKESTA